MDELDLIESLRALGTRLEVPRDETLDEQDDFVAAVVRRVGQERPPLQRRRARRARRMRRLATVLAASLLIAAPWPREAVARWLGIGSVRVTRGAVHQDVPDAIRDLQLGDPTTLDAAGAALHRRVWAPRDVEPLGVWLQPEVPMVNTVYRIGGHDVLISELPGPGDVYLVKQVPPEGGDIEFFQARGQTGVWISGRPHSVAMATPSNIEDVPVRLAGDVLLWADQDRTIRIEGLVARSDALNILASLE